MRILVVAPQPFFTPRGTPFSVYYRTLVTAQLGARIDLLTYGEGEDVDIPGVRIIRIPRVPGLRDVAVGPSIAKLLLDVLLFGRLVAALVRNRYQVVHAHEEAIFFCRFLKPMFGFKLIYDMHSSLPEQLRNFEFTSSRFLYRLFQRLEDTSLRNADAVITICPELANYALPRVRDPSRHFLIENSIFEDVRLANRTSVRQPEHSNGQLPRDRPIIAYAGTFEPYQGLGTLLRAFALVRDRRPDALLLLVGGTPAQIEEHRRLTRELGIEADCVFTGRVDKHVAGQLMSKAAVLTSPRAVGNNTPLKVYEQLASGIPLVATRILAHTQVLSEDVCFLVDPEPESMAAGLLAALEDRARREEVVARAQQLYRTEYSRPAYERKMRALLESLA